MTTTPNTFMKRFLNVFTLLHFGYFADAEKELNDVIEAPDEVKDSQHAKPIANLVLNWVKDTQKEQSRV